MTEIEVSRTANEDMRKTNEDLRKNLHQRDRRCTRERRLNLPLRDRPKPFLQWMSLCHRTTSRPRLFLQEWKTLKIISRNSMPIWLFSEELFSARCSWAHSQVQPYSGSVGFPIVISPLLSSSPYYLENSSLSTRSSFQCCMTSSMWDKGRGSRWRITWTNSRHL